MTVTMNSNWKFDTTGNNEHAITLELVTALNLR
jgi:hypothetical protein